MVKTLANSMNVRLSNSDTTAFAQWAECADPTVLRHRVVRWENKPGRRYRIAYVKNRLSKPLNSNKARTSVGVGRIMEASKIARIEVEVETLLGT